MRIYWIENGRQCGPASVPDMLAKVQMGELTRDTQGWHAGCEGWRPLYELPALADFLAEDPAPVEQSEPAAAESQGQEPTPNQGITVMPDFMLPGPMPRFIARLVDCALYATLALGVLYVFQVPYRYYFNPGSPFFWAPMPLLEALLLYTRRTTPGKRMMSIYVRSIGRGLSFKALVLRSYLVFIMGMGCMIFPITLITLAFSFYSLSKRGIALWDVHIGSLPIIAKRPSFFSFFFSVLFMYMAMNLCAQYLQPWLPDMLEEAKQSAPAWAEAIENLMRQSGRN